VANVDIGDIIRVYSDPQGTILLGNAFATETNFTFTIGKLGESAGTVYVTRTSAGRSESAITAFPYAAAQ
jgi:hypothetical protein